jgi:tetratricopeptide (TPR) repeat protein
MGLNYKDQGDFDQALRNYKLALEIREESLDKTHPDVVAVRHNIGQLFFDKGNKEEAMKYFNDNLEMLEKNEGLNNDKDTK